MASRSFSSTPLTIRGPRPGGDEMSHSPLLVEQQREPRSESPPSWRPLVGLLLLSAVQVQRLPLPHRPAVGHRPWPCPSSALRGGTACPETENRARQGGDLLPFWPCQELARVWRPHPDAGFVLMKRLEMTGRSANEQPGVVSDFLTSGFTSDTAPRKKICALSSLVEVLHFPHLVLSVCF